MNADRVAAVARAVLYEGYILYPYRPSALKNRRRFNFGVIAPRADARALAEGGTWRLRAECLAYDAERPFEVRLRFLHLTSRRDAAGGDWQEAVEREVPVAVRLDDLRDRVVRRAFEVAAGIGAGADGVAREHAALRGTIELSGAVAAPGVLRIAVEAANETPVTAADQGGRDAGLARSLVSAHAILHIPGGAFVSLLDPPADLAGCAASCTQGGWWPVLAGDEGERDGMLASPIILYDHPQIAPESAADFFDGTEIDEMLVLRVLTMTDAEKQEMREGDPRARRLLEQAETLPPEHLRRLHGALRGAGPR